MRTVDEAVFEINVICKHYNKPTLTYGNEGDGIGLFDAFHLTAISSSLT